MIQLTIDVLLSRSYYTVKSNVTIDVMYSFTSYNNWCILNLHILLYLLYCNTYSELYCTVQYYAFGTNKYQIPLKVYMTPEWGGLIIAVDQVYF